MSEPLTWRTSSFCHGGGCVAVAQHANGDVHVTNTRDPERRSLVFGVDQWRQFILGVESDEFYPPPPALCASPTVPEEPT